ncbi:MAG: hypothetical protein HKP14_03500 [Bacteroidia bacterium]|nr:hypothetical protein [Bacteroidia bacterium]
MPRTALTFIAFWLLAFSTLAQNFQISGVAINRANNTPVPFSSIALSSPSDTSVIQFVVAEESGKFKITNVKSGDYLIMSASVGYEVLYYPITVSKDVSSIILEMEASSISFEEVMIQADKIPILLNGDTIVYNTNSFKTQSNASVEDLIKKMPGIKVNKDGSVSAEGEQITKVLINGKEFFGGNVEAATKNLDADLVDKVEVIDKKTDEDEFTGEDDNQREKVINLVLKEEHTQGYFGTLRGSYGTQDYYDAHGNINFFKDETQLSIIGGMNNLDKSLYGWKDMGTLQSFEINPFNSGNNTWWWNGGVKTYKGVGANLHLIPAKGLKTDIAYVITDESSLKEAQNNAEVYLTNNTLFSETVENSRSNRLNHQINTKIEFKSDTLSRLVFRGQFSKSFGSANNASRTYNYSDTAAILNSGVNLDQVEDGNMKFVGKLHWTKKNRKKTDNHFLGSVYYGNEDKANDYSTFYNTDNFLLPFPKSEVPLLDQNLRTTESTIATTSAYQFKLNKKWTIRPGFNYMLSNYTHQLDWLPKDDEKELDKSPIGNVQAQNMEYFMHISYKLDSVTTFYIVPEVNQVIEDREFTTDSTHRANFNQYFFVPYMFIRSNKPHKYNFHFNVRANLQKPQVNQILPVTDNSNPYRTSIGNIALKNYMNYNNSWRYKRLFGLGKSISISGWNSLSLNPVINKNTTTEDNYSISEVINFKDRVYSNASLEFGWPFKAIKAQLEFDIDYNYGQAYFIQNNEEIFSQNEGWAIGPGIQFNEFDKWSLELDYMLNFKTGNIDGIENNAYINHEIDGEFILTPVDRLEWSTTLYMEVFGSNNAVGAQSIPVLSSELSYYFDKNKRWSLGIRAFDILDKNQNLWRWWSSNRFVQSQNNTVRRHVRGTLIYKIKKPTPKAPSGGEPIDKRSQK